MKQIYTAKFLISGNAPPLEDGALLVHAGMIAGIGSRKDITRNHPGIEVVDFSDALIVPLLINAHTHLELTDFPLWVAKADEDSPPGDFVDWILRLIRVKQKLTEKQYRDSLRHGIDQSIAAGTGAVGDILSQHGLRNIYQNCSLPGLLFLETLGQDPAFICRLRAGLNDALDDEIVGKLELGISPHSPYTISLDYLQSLYRQCRTRKIRCTTHVAESAHEVDFVKRGQGPLASRLYSYIGWENYTPEPSGLRPVEYLYQQGGLFPENLLVHGVQLNADEITLLAKNQMSLALCPRSNATLNVGKAPVAQLYKAGVILALGTDSLASCDSLSIWDEMAFAHHWFEGQLDAPTLFSMATQGGAQALGIKNEVGSLEIGKNAGFQILRPKTTVASEDIFDYFVSPACASDIIQVYHQGRPQLSGVTC
ncbi:amidohydrolase family protein [uncultured Desulfuromusa sp.]|uniref:amidohydrolase family protein n=1 Tax=uncultured Desulfuromusa sp. TaxID=219183 RepID=UPI002AA7FE9B|nr:amidohydrolase family protein [uncultured Desulfuromusa sp.]